MSRELREAVIANMTEDELLMALKRSGRRHVEKMIEKFSNVPQNAAEMWDETGMLLADYVKVRTDMLKSAGWDPAGWAVMEWHRLPSNLRTDLTKIYPEYRKLVEEASAEMLPKLRALL